MDFRELFRKAADAAENLERCKMQIAAIRETVSSPKSMRYDAVHVSSSFVSDPTNAIDSMLESERKLRERSAAEYESIIDAAWEAINIVSADISDLSAQVLSQHYLFGMPWIDVAHSIMRKSETTPKTIANAALDWLDSYCEVSEDADGIHVRMLRQ